jgi:3-isopropylmalate/(R)-2-methylmalate dehydratase large subunit
LQGAQIGYAFSHALENNSGITAILNRFLFAPGGTILPAIQLDENKRSVSRRGRETKMAGRTIAEKILGRAAGMPVRVGELAICEPDLAMGTDGSIPMALDYLHDMRPDATPYRPERMIFALDHYGAVSGDKALALQERARVYGQRHGIRIYDIGEGIGHQLILEQGAARPGALLVGADSHSTSYGAVNAFATGIGSSDLAGVLLCGQIWLKVPASIRIVLTGALPRGVSAKDAALTLARQLGADGAAYQVLEFAGPGVAALDMDDRIVLSNMSVEVGAKAGIFPHDATTARWLEERGANGMDLPRHDPVHADADALYTRTVDLDLSRIQPQVALPHRVDNVVDAAAAPATRVDMVYLGTCTGGRVKDYAEALEAIQAGGGIAQGVRVIVTPASRAIQEELERNGMLAAFQALGAQVQPPGCGSCCGTCGTVPADGQNVVSSANRNFKGRMGNGRAAIYLASPRLCGAAAASGRLGGEAEPS